MIDAVIGHRYIASDGSMWDCKGIDSEDLAIRRMYCSAAHDAQDVRRFFTNGRCYCRLPWDDNDVHLVEDLGATDKAFDWSSRPEHTKECWDAFHMGDHIWNDDLIQMIKSTKETLAYFEARRFNEGIVGRNLTLVLRADVQTLEGFARARKLTF